MPAVLWALLCGNFVIGAGVMVVPATLNDIADSFRITAAAAGQLITVGGVVMCVCAPLCATLVASWDRRRLLALTMLWYGLLHVACAAAPGFTSLLPLRALAVLAPAVFTPQAAACVGLLVPAADRGRAITFVFLGWSLASVLGMPIGAWIGGSFGWRAAFLLIALLSAASAAWVWRAMPQGVRPQALSRAAWVQVLRSPPLMLCIAVTVLYAGGQFVLFSYFAPYFRSALAATPGNLALLFMWFGLFGVVGNLLMARFIDRLGPDRAVLVAVCCMAASLAAWPLGTTLWLAALVCVPWALGCFSSNSAQQARLVGLAPGLAPGSIALNSSAMYAGQAVGAATGGWLIAAGGYGNLNWVGLGCMLLAVAASAAAGRATRTAAA
jgi:predicted MFS family arabinose efflux permease